MPVLSIYLKLSSLFPVTVSSIIHLYKELEDFPVQYSFRIIVSKK